VSLDNLIQEIKGCTKCSLCKGRINVVAGDGNPHAEIMFIGEGPGKNEDLQGLPFVGAAGKFLEEMLAEIGLKRSDIYITNVVKCRPPENRDPLPEEKQACWTYLIEQVKLIQPKLIAFLGRHAMGMFLPETLKISEVHGQAKIYWGIEGEKSGQKQVYLPLYHPAAALYNGGMRNKLKDDFRRIPSILKKIDTLRVEGKI
jgi:uracil-DNA glycosylase